MSARPSTDWRSVLRRHVTCGCAGWTLAYWVLLIASAVIFITNF